MTKRCPGKELAQTACPARKPWTEGVEVTAEPEAPVRYPAAGGWSVDQATQWRKWQILLPRPHLTPLAERLYW